jgi:hypothetical protein
MSPSELKLRVSGGLFVLAGIHALVMATVLVMAQPSSNAQPNGKSNVANYFPADKSMDDIFYSSPRAAAPVSEVNLAAQDERKQSILEEPREQCLNCPPLPQQRPTYRQPIYVQPVYPQPTPAPALPQPQYPQPTPAPALPPIPAISRPLTPPPSPVVKKYQFMVFYDNSEQSRMVLDWLRNDARFIRMRKGDSITSVQYYTEDNALYRARFSKIIPADQFPVVLLTDADGGHIHAAGGNFIPPTADQLYDDMTKGLELYQSAKKHSPAQGLVGSGAIKQAGYFFNPAVSPQQRLFMQDTEDCPDGNCDPELGYDGSRNRDGRLLDQLFSGRDKAKSVMAWASATELVLLMAGGLLSIIVLALAFVLVKRLLKR